MHDDDPMKESIERCEIGGIEGRTDTWTSIDWRPRIGAPSTPNGEVERRAYALRVLFALREAGALNGGETVPEFLRLVALVVGVPR